MTGSRGAGSARRPYGRAWLGDDNEVLRPAKARERVLASDIAPDAASCSCYRYISFIVACSSRFRRPPTMSPVPADHLIVLISLLVPPSGRGRARRHHAALLTDRRFEPLPLLQMTVAE